MSTMIDDKIDYLWCSGKAFDARVFTALKPWLMRGLPISEETDGGRAAATAEEDGGESKAESGSGGKSGGRRSSGGKSGLAAARELFRWRDDETETAETKRTGIGLLFWCSLNDNVEAVLELAKKAAVIKNGRSRKRVAQRAPRKSPRFVRGLPQGRYGAACGFVGCELARRGGLVGDGSESKDKGGERNGFAHVHGDVWPR